jgi:hypothetical protein
MEQPEEERDWSCARAVWYDDQHSLAFERDWLESLSYQLSNGRLTKGTGLSFRLD